MTNKSKYIQIKNAKKIFRKHFFKMLGHDFPRVYNDVGSKMSLPEAQSFSKYHSILTNEAGDYEVYVEVLPNKIKITKFYEMLK